MTKKTVNHGEVEIIQVPCLLRLVGQTHKVEGYLTKDPNTKIPETKPPKIVWQNTQNKALKSYPTLMGVGGDCSFNSVEFCLYIMV